MATAIWTMFAGAALVGMFAACVAVVVVAVRALESRVDKRRPRAQ